MTESELNNIEGFLGCQLPARYRFLLLNYPQTLIDQGEFGAANFDLYHSEGKLIEANGQASWMWPDRPDSFVIVGDDGFGEVFAIDTSDDGCPVYGLSPHHGEFKDNVDAGVPVRLAETVDEWARLLAKREF